MRIVSTGFRVALAGALAMTMASCTMFGRGGGSGPGARGEWSESGDVQGSDYEARLRRLVERRVAATRQSPGGEGELVRRRPYYFREYDYYPEGAAGMQIAIRETDSRVTPFEAEVRLPKQRFATRMHRDRADAAQDANYLRDTGTEIMSYEFRSGRWDRTGSLFLVERSEENINGEWVPVEERVRRTIAEEEDDRGWFGRFWSGLVGR